MKNKHPQHKQSKSWVIFQIYHAACVSMRSECAGHNPKSRWSSSVTSTLLLKRTQSVMDLPPTQNSAQWLCSFYSPEISSNLTKPSFFLNILAFSQISLTDAGPPLSVVLHKRRLSKFRLVCSMILWSMFEVAVCYSAVEVKVAAMCIMSAFLSFFQLGVVRCSVPIIVCLL